MSNETPTFTPASQGDYTAVPAMNHLSVVLLYLLQLFVVILK